MTKNEILIKAADTIDESVATLRIKTKKKVIEILPKYVFFGIKLGKKTVEKEITQDEIYLIRPATLRTMVRISKQMIGTEIGEMPESNNYLQWVFNAIADNGEKQARIIAIAIHNSGEEVPQSLVDMVLDNFNSEELWKVSQIVIDKLNIIPFMNTITSVKSIQVLKKEVSPMEKEEIIASGEQSEVLSNILGSATIIQ